MIVTALLGGLCLGLPSYGIAASDETHDTSVHTAGYAEISLPANIAVITGALSIKKPTASQAVSENANILQNIRTAWEKSGFDADDIISVNYSLSPYGHYDDAKQMQIHDGFEIAHILKVNLSDSKKVGQAVDVLVKNGLNNITDIAFNAKNDEKIYAELLKNAVADARQKAQIIMEESNGKNLRLDGITVQNDNNTYPVPMMTMVRGKSESDSVPTEFNNDNKKISVSVNTEWEFDY